MTENMKKWMELVSQNEVLQKKLQDMADDTRDDSIAKMIEIAKENGITLTADDFETPPCEELSDDELDAVAGGKCGCFLGGGGEGIDKKNRGNKHYKCVCVGWGHGYIDGGCKGSEKMNCVCPAVGGGTDDFI